MGVWTRQVGRTEGAFPISSALLDGVTSYDTFCDCRRTDVRECIGIQCRGNDPAVGYSYGAFPLDPNGPVFGTYAVRSA